MAVRFYTPEDLAIGELTLAGAEAHHIATVRRFSPGDRVVLFNGDGHEYPAEIIGIQKRQVTLRILARETTDRELPFPLLIAAALPKGDRADFLIEKLTELGVTHFVPLITQRAIVQPKTTVVEKFTRTVIEASKQCGRNVLMKVEPPAKWDQFIARDDLPAARVLLHTDTGLPSLPPLTGGLSAAIGPEGGFSPDELVGALDRGWLPVSLGPRILRVETAAIAAALLGSRLA